MKKNILNNIIIFVCITIIIALFHQLMFYKTPFDDSYISYRYAKNWAEGLGLVFNQGEKVEGYSNFLWVIILGVFYKIGLDLEIAGKLLSLLFTAGTFYVLFKVTKFIRNGIPVTYIDFTALIFLCLSPLYSFWCATGSEVSIFSFLVILTVYLFLREEKLGLFPFSGIALLLLAITRPEAVLFAGLLLIYEVITIVVKLKKKENRNLHLFTRSIKRYLIFFAGYGIYILWRYAYYGYLLPNTYYSKRGGEALVYFLKTGFNYWSNFVFNKSAFRDIGIMLHPTGGNGLILYFIIPILILILLYMKKKFKKPWFKVSSLFLFGYAIYIILAGGDVMPWYRFYTFILPLFFFLVQEGLREFSNLKFLHRKYLNAIVISVVLVLCAYTINFWRNNKLYTKRMLNGDGYVAMKKLGNWFKKSTPKDTMFTCADIGIIPYFAERKAKDYFGLTDIDIAHSKGEHYGRAGKGIINYLISCNPDYMILVSKTNPETGMFTGNYPIDVALFNDEDFKRNYTIYTSYADSFPFYLESSPGYYLVIFKRIS